MVWVGIDDTDAPTGGCTTWAMTEVVRIARAHGLDPIGAPRLVRLNPNVPWKTRGNAALAARFGHGVGRATVIGSIDGQPVRAYRRGRPPSGPARRAFVAEIWGRLRALAPRARGTDPALVVTDRAPPARLYWGAVRGVVGVGENAARLDRFGAETHHRGGRRGLIGAAAAIAWPARWSTWELIAYRPAADWGTPRRVDAASVRRAQRAQPGLFLCHDPRTRRVLVAPHTPCPILFGLRGRTVAAVRGARPIVRGGRVDRWIVFRTNQGSGDHLRERPPDGIRPFESGIVHGTIVAVPGARAGGHVTFDLEDSAGRRANCVAFEPTKVLPRVAAALVPGDRVTVWGSRGRGPTLRLEGIRVDRLVPRIRARKPRCRRCDRVARSLGRARGFRCTTCHRRWPPEAATTARRSTPLRERTAYHPTASARRHLAPLAPER